MAAIEDDILTTFFAKLETSEDVTPAMLESLRRALASKVKLKPEDLVRIFAPPSEEDIP
jgi:hypothetical protein